MKLIGTANSPYVRKVRVVLKEKKIDCEFEQIATDDLYGSENALSQYNPLGKVPCLVMEDGKTFFDSSVIVDFLDTISPVGKLLPTGGRPRAEVKCWESLANGIMDASALVLLEDRVRTKEQRSEIWVKRQMGKIHAAVKAIAEELGDRPYCFGDKYTLADIAVGCALGFISLRFNSFDWRKEYENLARLFDKISERPSFRETAPET